MKMAVTRLGVMTISQAHRYIYDLAPETVRKRIGKMADAGLLNRVDTLAWAGVIIWPTRAGRQAILDEESPLLSMEPPSESTMLHRLLVAEEALKIMAAGVEVITEREARLYEIGSTPDTIEDRDMFLAGKGVRRSVNGSRGVVPTQEGTQHGVVDRYLILPTPGAESTYRIPDLFEVTRHGELRAIEVELSPKRPARLRGILAGYREACSGHHPAPRGAGKTIPEVGVLRRQFAGVRWVATEPVLTMLRGPEGGVNRFTGKEDIGLVRPLWDATPSTHLLFAHPGSWAMEKVAWPLSVAPLDLSHDPGLEYALCQTVLPSRFRSTISQWRTWRKIWAKEVQEDENPVPFPLWLRAPGTLERCRQATWSR